MEKKEQEGESLAESTLQEYVIKKANQKFIDFIPVESIKELPDNFKYPLGAFSIAFMISVFFALVATSYQASKSTYFISLQPDGLLCTSVPRPLTGNFLASQNGVWSGAMTFNYSQATYSFQFQNYTSSNDDGQVPFNELMAEVSAFISTLGFRAQNQSLAYNVLIWMNSALFINTGSSQQIFTFAGSPSYVFNRQYFWVNFVSSETYCPVESSMTYDINSATFHCSLPTVKFAEVCGVNTFDLAKVAANPSLSEYQFTIDMRSITTAIAINLHLRRLQNMVIVTNGAAGVLTAAPPPGYTSYGLIDPLYPGMKPIQCLFRSASISEATLEFCMVVIGTQPMYPVIQSLNLNATDASYFNWASSEPCSCQSPSPSQSPTGTKWNCNQMAFIVGMFIVPDPMTIVGMYQQQAEDEGVTVNRVINDASYSAMYESSMIDPRKSIQAAPAAVSAFCGPNCSLISMVIFDDVNYGISEYYYPLTNGSCRDTLTTPAFSLLQTPPTSLTESYLNCTNNWETNSLNAVGISQGNTTLAMIIFSILMVPFIFMVMKLSGHTPPREEYPKQELDDALMELALQLLRARDGKTRGLAKANTLISLAEDLVTAARKTGGYPDSDDSDESDDSGGDNDGFGVGGDVDSDDEEIAAGKKKAPKRQHQQHREPDSRQDDDGRRCDQKAVYGRRSSLGARPSRASRAAKGPHAGDERSGTIRESIGPMRPSSRFAMRRAPQKKVLKGCVKGSIGEGLNNVNPVHSSPAANEGQCSAGGNGSKIEMSKL